MQRAFRHILPFTLALVLLASCDEDGPADGFVPAVMPRTSVLEAPAGSIWVSVEAKGSWTINLEFDDEGGWAVVEPSTGEGSVGNVRLRYQENTGEALRRVTLTIVSGGHVTKATVVQSGVSSGEETPGTFVNGSDVAAADWLELPATKAGDGLTFFVHDMEGGAYRGAERSGVRNWSFYWDVTEHLSLWVAYPLNNSLKGNGSRSNAWGLDPLLPASAQPDITTGSYGGGWTRGHQIPSADRVATVRANASTFYSTNMTPQDYDFNCEIWANLEARVRSYASLSDTLYVVTGCLYEGSELYSGSNAGFQVKIPTHYFKALLFRGHSSYATDGFMAAGFLLPHSSSIAGGQYVNYICSIDELESQTGIDFFPNLEALLGKAKADAIEAQAPSNWWK